MTTQIFSNPTELRSAFDGRIVGLTGLRSSSIEYAISWLPSGCTYELVTIVDPITADHVIYVIALAPAVVIPQSVEESVKSAVSTIVEFNAEIERLRKFDDRMASSGRYEADGFINLRDRLISAKQAIENFRKACKSKKINADKYLKSYGCVMHLEPSSSASEWLDAQ